MGVKSTAHRPSQSRSQYVTNSAGHRVRNTAYRAPGQPHPVKPQALPQSTAPKAPAKTREWRNSELIAWAKHLDVQQRPNEVEDYESDDDYATPHEKALEAIRMSGVLRMRPGASCDVELPEHFPFEREYIAPKGIGDGMRTNLRLSEEEKSRQHWLIDRSQAWMGHLTDEEQAAVLKWTTNGHVLLHEYLFENRIGKGETAESIQEFNRLLHSALSHPVAALDEPIHVYRGIDSDFLFDEEVDVDVSTAEGAAEYILQAFCDQPLTNDEMPRSATLSPAVASSTFTSGYYKVVLDIEVDEIYSPVNVSRSGLIEEEVLLVGNIMVADVAVKDNIIVVSCYLD